MRLYYHLTKQKLDAGDQLHPGNYGKIVMQTGPVHIAYRREMAYEMMRSAYFPNLPSRLACLFCFLTIEEGKMFKRHLERAQKRPTQYGCVSLERGDRTDE